MFIRLVIRHISSSGKIELPVTLDIEKIELLVTLDIGK